MKTLNSFLIVLFFSGTLSAQGNLDFAQKELDKKEFSLQIFNGFETQFEPAFTGLFQTAFNRINRLIKWQNIYDDTDVGFQFMMVCNLKRKWRIESKYLLGLLNFDKRGFGQARGYQFQVSLTYNL